MYLKLNKFIPFSILIITISSINQWSNLPIGNTIIWWCIYAGILFSFIKSKAVYYDIKNNSKIGFVRVYIFWNMICVFRGLFVAENYWEWKNLIETGMVLALPVSIYVTTNKLLVQRIISTWVKYALPAFFVFLLTFKYGDAIGRYLVPVSFLLLFFPQLTAKWKAIVVIFTLFVFFGYLGARSNIIKFGVPIILSMFYYTRNLVSNKVFRFTHFLLFIFPIIFFVLGTSNIFNIFKMDEYITGEYKTSMIVDGQISEQSLTADTRTFLYVEVISSAFKHNYWIFGRTPARGNDSVTFGLFNKDKLKTGKMERFSNEVSILNIFTWTGMLGVLIYFLVFLSSSLLAVNRSNNITMRIVGVCVAFRWSYAWVEDFSQFDLSYFFLWLMIGMCFSKSFREMSDREMKHWILGIFDKRYRKASQIRQYQIS